MQRWDEKRCWKATVSSPDRSTQLAKITTTEEATVQVQVIGPGGIDFVNPADDSRKRSTALWARAFLRACPFSHTHH